MRKYILLLTILSILTLPYIQTLHTQAGTQQLMTLKWMDVIGLNNAEVIDLHETNGNLYAIIRYVDYNAGNSILYTVQLDENTGDIIKAYKLQGFFGSSQASGLATFYTPLEMDNGKIVVGNDGYFYVLLGGSSGSSGGGAFSFEGYSSKSSFEGTTNYYSTVCKVDQDFNTIWCKSLYGLYTDITYTDGYIVVSGPSVEQNMIFFPNGTMVRFYGNAYGISSSNDHVYFGYTDTGKIILSDLYLPTLTISIHEIDEPSIQSGLLIYTTPYNNTVYILVKLNDGTLELIKADLNQETVKGVRISENGASLTGEFIQNSPKPALIIGEKTTFTPPSRYVTGIINNNLQLENPITITLDGPGTLHEKLINGKTYIYGYTPNGITTIGTGNLIPIQTTPTNPTIHHITTQELTTQNAGPNEFLLQKTEEQLTLTKHETGTAQLSGSDQAQPTITQIIYQPLTNNPTNQIINANLELGGTTSQNTTQLIETTTLITLIIITITLKTKHH